MGLLLTESLTIYDGNGKRGWWTKCDTDGVSPDVCYEEWGEVICMDH